MGRACSMLGDKGNAYRVLVGKPEEKKKALVRLKCRWEYNFKMDRREIEWVDMDWINLTQDNDKWRPLVNTIVNLRVP
jgi:hypothetical protein